jgi:transcriptional regulator with PAS, ATPase and Fis domain
VTRSPLVQRVLAIAEGVAGSRAPVLIQGESGTGKELLARHVHASGPRRTQPFVAVNCAALPRELLESELFGHERGAFTGAIARKLGKFEMASGGTILLDEISELELPLQAKLLRVLQEHEVDRVGGTRPVAIDARVIATTNQALGPLVASGAFRRDLYYRLHVIPLTLPPLRERGEDVDHLIDHFCARFGGACQLVVEPAARAYLRRHPWPGNVRELEHVMERAALLAAGPTITLADVAVEDGLAAEAAPDAAMPMLESTDGDEMPVGASLAGLTVHEIERRLIMATLERTQNNRSHAAKMLGISVRTLRNKLAEYRGVARSKDAQ